MKRIVLFIWLLSVIFFCFLSSCSEDVTDINDLLPNSIEIVSEIVEDDTNPNFIFDSYENFLFFLNNMDIYSDNKEYEYPPVIDEVDLRATVTTVLKVGCTSYNAYSGMTDMKISFSDIQTANKLGLVANKTYYLTIREAFYRYFIQSNHRPSIASSPLCGLLMDNPRTDDFTKAIRGYKAIYDQPYGEYRMHSTLLSFKESLPSTSEIWYPCKPDKVEWNINILVL